MDNSQQEIVALFLDLDDTLYNHSSGIRKCMHQRIYQFMEEKLGIKNAEEYGKQLQQKHITILDGLLANGYGEKIGDFIEYYRFVNSGFTLEDKIPFKDPKLHDMLVKLKTIQQSRMIKNPNYKFILHLFSNANIEHVERVLKFLGIFHLFDSFTTYEYLLTQCKPHKNAYSVALQRAGVWDAFQESKCTVYFVDDAIQNVEAAKEHYDWHVVHINENHHESKFVHSCEHQNSTPQNVFNPKKLHIIREIYDLEHIVPHLFQE